MARWTDIADWRGPTQNQGGSMTAHRGVVLHIAEGWYEGTIAWQRDPTSRVSSHFIVGRDGQVAQMVDTDTTAWTQIAGNGQWLSIELEGFSPGNELNPGGWQRLSDTQVDAVARLVARGHEMYGFPLQATSDPSGQGLGHHSMGGTAWGGNPDCPGDAIIAQKDTILARARARALAGSAGAGAGEGMPPPGSPVPFPLPSGYFFGPAERGNLSVSGRYSRRFGDRTGRQWLQEWTRQLRRRGWPAGRGRRYLTEHGADGIYGPEYAELVEAFQRDQRLVPDQLLGQLTWHAAYHNPVT